MLTSPTTTRIAVPADVLIREMDGESVLLHLSNSSYFGLDEVGTQMWKTLVASDSLQTAYDTLQTMYDVEATQLWQDLQALVEKLAQHSLIELHTT